MINADTQRLFFMLANLRGHHLLTLMKRGATMLAASDEIMALSIQK